MIGDRFAGSGITHRIHSIRLFNFMPTINLFSILFYISLNEYLNFILQATVFRWYKVFIFFDFDAYRWSYHT